LSHSTSISQRLISGSLFASAGKILLAVSALAINAFIARLLPPESVGIYYIIASITAIGAIAVQFGSHQAIVKLIASNTAIRPSLKAVFLIVIIGVLLFCSVYLLGVGQFVNDSIFHIAGYNTIYIPTALWVALLGLQILFSQIFRGFHKIGYAAIFEGVSTSVFMVVILSTIWILYGSATINTILWAMNASLFLSFILALGLFRKTYLSSPCEQGINIRGVTTIALPLFIASIAMPGFTESHVWILSAFSTEDDVAVYGAAFRMAKFVVVPLLVINSVIPPMIAKLVAEDKKEAVERVLRATATIAGIPSVLIVMLLFFIGSDVLSIVFGEFYEKGHNVLLILACAQAINALTGSPGVLLMMSGHQGIFMKLALFSGLFGVITSYLLVTSMSYTGVAIGVASGLIVNNVAMWFYCRQKVGVKTHMGFSAVGDVFLVFKTKFVHFNNK